MSNPLNPITGLVKYVNGAPTLAVPGTDYEAPGDADTVAPLGYAASINLQLDGAAYQTLTLTGDVTFTTSGLASGRAVAVVITADSTARNVTFPAWKFIGAAAPASIAAGKTAVLSLTSIGTTDAAVIAAYAVQP